MTRLAAALLLVAVPLAGACSEELPPVTRVDKLRVLAVRAEPPEVAPGQVTVLDTLTALPPLARDARPPTVTYLWLACIQAPGAIAPRPCTLPPAGDGGVTMPPACADDPDANPCSLGTGGEVRYAPPERAIFQGDGDIGQALVTVYVADETIGGAPACARDAVDIGGASPSPDHCVVGLKRVTVTRDAALPSRGPRNRNPALDGITLDGASLLDGSARFAIAPDAKQPLALVATRRPDSSDPLPDALFEPLYVAWFASAGAVDGRRTTFQPADCPESCQKSDPPATTTIRWMRPTADDAARFVPDGTVRFWAVIHDDRGGVGWIDGAATVR